MATRAQRRLEPTDVRLFGSGRDHELPPDLTKIQTASYAEFLQDGVASDKRKDQGLESVMREIFPIDRGPLVKQNIQGHTTSPTTVDFNGDGVPDFLGGAENGRFYYMRNPRSE